MILNGETRKRSEGRIFTTHTGRLPRPHGLVELLGAVARGESVDQSALDDLAAGSTLEVIRQQAKAGVDVMNSDEQSRTSFSTYVTQRMSGFGGSWTGGVTGTRTSSPTSPVPAWSN